MPSKSKWFSKAGLTIPTTKKEFTEWTRSANQSILDLVGDGGARHEAVHIFNSRPIKLTEENRAN